ncbi:hypothetical protein CL684_02915 [Candidatus Campbellbacteria bacterium]|nr:hypothetical protein [Candidatus Campbellbacteria bacterium]|tara:strand:+ start:290 stop:631 length:342 start_codon:yes stop_codon:yes gene_type:complete
MRKFLLHIIGSGLIVYFLLPELVNGISIDTVRTTIIVALLFAVINFAVKPIVSVITLPLNLITLGIFGFIVNVLLFWFVADIIDGFVVLTFMDAVYGSIILTVGNWILDKVAR